MVLGVPWHWIHWNHGICSRIVRQDRLGRSVNDLQAFRSSSRRAFESYSDVGSQSGWAINESSTIYYGRWVCRALPNVVIWTRTPKISAEFAGTNECFYLFWNGHASNMAAYLIFWVSGETLLKVTGVFLPNWRPILPWGLSVIISLGGGRIMAKIENFYHVEKIVRVLR